MLVTLVLACSSDTSDLADQTDVSAARLIWTTQVRRTHRWAKRLGRRRSTPRTACPRLGPSLVTIVRAECGDSLKTARSASRLRQQIWDIGHKQELARRSKLQAERGVEAAASGMHGGASSASVSEAAIAAHKQAVEKRDKAYSGTASRRRPFEFRNQLRSVLGLQCTLTMIHVSATTATVVSAKRWRPKVCG